MCIYIYRKAYFIYLPLGFAKFNCVRRCTTKETEYACVEEEFDYEKMRKFKNYNMNVCQHQWKSSLLTLWVCEILALNGFA